MEKSPPLHPDILRVLTVLPFEQLGADDQMEAVEWARGIARFEVQDCASRKSQTGRPTFPEQWLTHRYPLDYYRHIVQPARTQGVIDRMQEQDWWVYLRGDPQSFDLRIISFLDAWEAEGREIVAARARAANGL